jgi:hypothetical protein
MKKLFTLLTIFFTLQIGIGFAQSLEVYDSKNTMINGETINVTTIYGEELVSYKVKIKNVSSERITFKIHKEIIGSAVEGSNNTVCTPSTESSTGLCEPGDSPVSSDVILKPGEISGYAEFDFTQGSNPGTTIIKYKLINNNDENDFVEFTIEFASPNSLPTLGKVKNLSIYPNPATTNFTIGYEFDSKSYIEIYNVLGKVVEKVNPTSGNSYNVDCSKWDKGYYFCRVIHNNKVERTLKIVVTN